MCVCVWVWLWPGSSWTIATNGRDWMECSLLLAPMPHATRNISNIELLTSGHLMLKALSVFCCCCCYSIWTLYSSTQWHRHCSEMPSNWIIVFLYFPSLSPFHSSLTFYSCHLFIFQILLDIILIVRNAFYKQLYCKFYITVFSFSILWIPP